MGYGKTLREGAKNTGIFASIFTALPLFGPSGVLSLFGLIISGLLGGTTAALDSRDETARRSGREILACLCPIKPLMC